MKELTVKMSNLEKRQVISSERIAPAFDLVWTDFLSSSVECQFRNVSKGNTIAEASVFSNVLKEFTFQHLFACALSLSDSNEYSFFMVASSSLNSVTIE